MVTILLEQIIEILKGWLSSFTSWAEGVAEKLGLIEEATEYIDDIYDDTTAIKDNTTSIADSNTRIQGYSLIISNKTSNIDSNVTAIKNNVGSIATSSGVTAAFAEDCATNGLNILDKVTTIASDTTQLRADNVVVKADLDKIYDALKWSLVGIDTTETEEGIGSVSFDTDKTDPLDQFVIAFTAVQSGSGDPSPDNVRPITGWSDFDITANDSILNIDLNGTYYGGSVDAVTGKIPLDHGLNTFDGTEANWSATDTHIFRLVTTGRNWLPVNSANWQLGYLSNMLRTDVRATGATSDKLPDHSFYITSQYLYVRCDEYELSDFKTALGSTNLQIVAPLATPIVVYASNVLSINTQKGLNTITSDSNGKMTVTYTESVKHYLDKQEG